MGFVKEEFKKPMEWKSIILVTVAILGFLKGCGNEFISANPDVKKIEQLESTVKRLETANTNLDHNVRTLENFKSWMEGKLGEKQH